MVKNTNLFLHEAFVGGSDAVATARARFGVLFTQKKIASGGPTFSVPLHCG